MTVTVISSSTHGCGQTVMCRVPRSARLSHRGKVHWLNKPVDKCLAPVVNALNALGVYTRACCCGHGAAPGNIILQDGTIIKVPVCTMLNGAGHRHETPPMTTRPKPPRRPASAEPARVAPEAAPRPIARQGRTGPPRRGGARR